MFVPSSRYYHIGTEKYHSADGRAHEYKRRRFLPLAPPDAPPMEIVLREHDRLDLFAARFLGDPQLFWRICDANDALDPFALTGTARAGDTLQVPTSHT